MTVTVSFDLTEEDLEHFRGMMKTAISNTQSYSQEEILEKASGLCDEMEQANVPTFVEQRLNSLKMLIAAVQDEEWQVPEDEKNDILFSLAYFAEPQDLVPDHIPGLGYVDDAIMIELVIQDMSLDLEAYEEFCQFRSTEEKRRGDDANVSRESWLESKRTEVRSRLRRRKERRGRRRVFGRIM